MLAFLFSISLFFLSGWLSLRALFGRKQPLSSIEVAALSFAVGVGMLDFSMIAIGESRVTLTTWPTILSFLTVPAVLFSIRKIYDHFFGKRQTKENPQHDFRLTRTEGLAFLALIGATLFLRTLFLSDTAIPTATDLGHHMYWSKLTAETGMLPEYAKREILTVNDESILSEPQPIADFIIGEHLPFAAIAILSGQSFFSAFPVNFLFLVNLLSLLALFVLAVRFAENMYSEKNISPFSVGLLVLLFSGPLFAFSSPEAKFVSGGVVGNLFGNLFIPLILLSLFRALREKDPRFLALATFLSFSLAYTHHLSSLILAFTFFGILVSLTALFHRELLPLGKRILGLAVSPYAIGTLLFAGIFFFLVAMPTYIETSAVNTAIGTPSKGTRVGLTFLQISDSIGITRVALGVAAILLAFFIRSIRQSTAFAFVVGWSGMLLIMTLRPGWVFLDIPSNRIGTYLSFPLAMLSGMLLASLAAMLRDTSRKHTTLLMPGRLFLFISLSLFAFSVWNGSADNQSTLSGKNKQQQVVEVFDASSFLAERSAKDDLLLKDHNYLVADSWMKLFFMRDYNYPLSRGFFKRYEDETKPREQCTLLMISTPNLPEGQKCFDDLGVNLIAVHPAYDTAQFEKTSTFSRIYTNDSIAIYERK